MYQCCAYFLWRHQIRPGLSQHSEADGAYLQVIENSIIEGTLLFIRKLNEFFKQRPNRDEKDDDLRAYDFLGFKNLGEFIMQKDYEQLHNPVVHMTLRVSRAGKVGWEM